MKPDVAFLIDVPPATISGNLHMGHVFSYCHMDFIARRGRDILKRTEGSQTLGTDPILYPFCFDCNGLPTEKLAQKERIFDQQGIIQFAQENSKLYSDLFQKTGMGWSPHHYHTFDKNAIAIAEMSFHDLVEKGYAYKATRDYFWCPKHRVSVSQASCLCLPGRNRR